MLNWEGIRDHFSFPLEIPVIFTEVQIKLCLKSDILGVYPLLVDPYAFMLAIRQHEHGRPGLEFGVMHPLAYNTNLKTQAAWAIATIVKDTRRWHEDALICVKGKSRADFIDWIEYFGTKYCPVGARNDPQGLNSYWLPRVREYYRKFYIGG